MGATLEIAGVQMDIAWEDPEANLRRAEAYVARAAGDGARLVALPEMFATGFSMKATEMARHAEAVVAWTREAARRHGVWILAGFAQPGEPRPLNALTLVSPAGEEALRYAKIHPFSLAREHEHFGAGTEVCTATVEGVRVSPFICYDLRFPEPFRAVADRTDLYVVIANWPEPRREAWRALLRARAIENQAWVLGVNRVGEGDRLVYVGDSALIDPLGRVHHEAGVAPALVRGAVDAGEVAAVRRRFSFLADRRPDVYARWQAR